jgi:hypothetical protein
VNFPTVVLVDFSIKNMVMAAIKNMVMPGA